MCCINSFLLVRSSVLPLVLSAPLTGQRGVLRRWLYYKTRVLAPAVENTRNILISFSKHPTCLRVPIHVAGLPDNHYRTVRQLISQFIYMDNAVLSGLLLGNNIDN